MRKTWAAGIAAALTMLSGCGDEDVGLSKAGGETKGKAHVLTMVTGDLALLDHKGLPAFVRAVERRSGGRLRIKLVLAQSLHGDATSEPTLRKGKADLAWEKRGFPDIPAMEVPYLPFLIDSHALQKELFERDYDERLLAALRRKPWLEPLAVLPGDLGRPYSTRAPLLTVADWRGIGLDTRSPVGPARDRAFRALGARLKYEPGFQLQFVKENRLTATEWIDRGLQFNGVGTLGVTGTYNAVTFTAPLVVVASRKRFAKLDTREQEWLREAGEDAQRAGLDWIGSEDREHLVANCRTTRLRAVLAPEAEIAKLRATVMRVYRAEKDPELRALVDLVERTRESVGPQTAGIPRECEGPVPAIRPLARNRDPRALDGRYRFDVTVENFAQAGVLDPEVNGADFAGTWTVTLKNGRSKWARRSMESALTEDQVVLELTYRVDGDRVTFEGDNWIPMTLRFQKSGGGDLRFRPEHQMDSYFDTLFGQRWTRTR